MWDPMGGGPKSILEKKTQRPPDTKKHAIKGGCYTGAYVAPPCQTLSMPAASRLGPAQKPLFSGAKQFCQSKFEGKSVAKDSHILMYAGIFAGDFYRTGTGKTVCFLMSVGLKWGFLFYVQVFHSMWLLR